MTDKAIRSALLTAKRVDTKSENIADYVADLLRQGRASEVTDDLMAQADPQRLHQHYTSGNTGQHMPMDYASRMARAKGMGFGETRLLHGTPHLPLDRLKPSEFGAVGPGVYLTERPSTAGDYARGYGQMNPKDTFEQDNERHTIGGNITPVLTKGDLQPFTDWTTAKMENMKAQGPYGSGYKADAEASSSAEKAGYSGVQARNENSTIFDPTNIRSQFARFDPRLGHLAHLSASTGGAMDLARAVMAKDRAGGQIAPSKFMPGVPRQVHKDGGKVAFMAGNHPDVPDVVYHGSAPKIATKGWTDEIDPEATQRNLDAQNFTTFKPSEHGNYGPGIYLTDSPKVASDYAQGIRADQSEAKPHGQVMKLHVSMKQPFTDEVLRHPAWRDYIKGALNKFGVRKLDESHRDDLIRKLDSGSLTVRDLFLHDTPHGTMVNQFGHSDIHNTIRRSGFDGIIAHRPDGSKEIVAFHPHQVKSAIGNNGNFDPSNPDITKAGGGRIGKSGGGAMDLRSKAAQVVRDQPQAKGNVDQMLAMMAARGVKPSELLNAGRPFGHSVSKEELAQHFENAVPKVQVFRHGEIDQGKLTPHEYELWQNLHGMTTNEMSDHLINLQTQLEKKAVSKTKYGEYTLPGGENYREHLLHLGDIQDQKQKLKESLHEQWEKAKAAGDIKTADQIVSKYYSLGDNDTDPNFRSSHWETPNVLAHLRMKDRDNGKTLHVEEVQSDWGQEGREKGFHDPAKPIEVFHTGTGKTVHATNDLGEAKRKAEELGPQYDYAYQDSEKPPTGPYVGNTQQWTDLALKHALSEAAKGGHDRVVFSPGEANADLYGQRKKVDKLVYNDASGALRGFREDPSDGYTRTTFERDNVKPEDLHQHVGKALAEQLKESGTAAVPGGKLGGHGMVDYYKNYVHPGALKLLRQHDPSIQPESYDLPGGYKGYSLPMTDTARQSILKNGFQAFKDGGEVDEPITAYHGSPHSFDKFDIAHLGTGEGNQAYGHGLYFAGNEKVAKAYRDTISKHYYIVGKRVISGDRLSDNSLPHENLALDAFGRFDNNKDKAIEHLKDFNINNSLYYNKDYQKAAKWLEKIEPYKNKGHIYKVKLHVKPSELLDWDKPLSEQHPNVQTALQSFGAKPEETGEQAYIRAGTHKFAVRAPNGKWGPGGDSYEESLAQTGGDPSKVRSIFDGSPQARSAGLLQRGIKGIRYLGTGPRDLSDGDPTHNYVMFHHDPVEVVDKYAYGGAVDAALALTRRFTKDGKAATMSLKSKGN